MADEAAACTRIAESYQAQRFDEADRIAREALGQFPSSARIAVEYGLSAYFRDDLLTALTRFATAWTRFPDCGDAYGLASVALRRAKRFDNATEIVELGLAATPDNALLHVERAWIATETGNIAAARPLWDHVRLTFPDTPEGYWVGSHLALQTGDLDFADAVSRAGYARFPKHAYILWQWAQTVSWRQDWDEATRRWQIALSLHPDMPEIREGSRSLEISRGLETLGDAEAPAADRGGAASASDLGSLLLRFEGLGDNCEFGIVQRLAGVEPLGLLRWASISPEQLVAMLDARFEGVGDSAYIECKIEPNDEYYAHDVRYFGLHTFLHVGQMTEAQAVQKVAQRSRFLAGKLRSDLAEAEKIFVHKHHRGALDDAQIEAMFAAIRRYGPSSLLCVHKVDQPEDGRRVRKLRDGLYLAAMPEFTDDPNEAAGRLDAWHDICRSVIAMP